MAKSGRRGGMKVGKNSRGGKVDRQEQREQRASHVQPNARKGKRKRKLNTKAERKAARQYRRRIAAQKTRVKQPHGAQKSPADYTAIQLTDPICDTHEVPIEACANLHQEQKALARSKRRDRRKMDRDMNALGQLFREAGYDVETYTERLPQ